MVHFPYCRSTEDHRSIDNRRSRCPTGEIGHRQLIGVDDLGVGESGLHGHRRLSEGRVWSIGAEGQSVTGVIVRCSSVLTCCCFIHR